MRKQATKWEKIFASHISNKGWLSRQYKDFSKLNSIKANNLIRKWARDRMRHFTKEELQMANKHIKRCWTSLATRETQIKATMRYHYIHIRNAEIKNVYTPNGSEDTEKLDHAYTAGGNVKWHRHSRKQFGSFLQN